MNPAKASHGDIPLILESWTREKIKGGMQEKYARVDHLKVGTWGTLLSSSFYHCFILHYIKVENITVSVVLVKTLDLRLFFAFFILYDFFLSGTNGRNQSRGGGTPQKKTIESQPR